MYYIFGWRRVENHVSKRRIRMLTPFCVVRLFLFVWRRQPRSASAPVRGPVRQLARPTAIPRILASRARIQLPAATLRPYRECLRKYLCRLIILTLKEECVSLGQQTMRRMPLAVLLHACARTIARL